MKRDKYWSEPKLVKSNTAGGGWWYANKGSIEVHCDADFGTSHTSVRIPRKALVEYIKRSAK